MKPRTLIGRKSWVTRRANLAAAGITPQPRPPRPHMDPEERRLQLLDQARYMTEVRNEVLSPVRRSEIARTAAKARWGR